MKVPAWYAGKTFTVSKYRMESDKYLDIQFVGGRKILVEIFDSEYNFPTDKVLAFPRVRLFVEEGSELWLNIECKYHELLDLPHQRCHQSEEYSLATCIEVRAL